MLLTQTRKRWLELLDLSYATRRVTHQQIERGIHAVVVPPAYREEKRKEILEADIRSGIRQIPELAHKVQLTLTKINDFNLLLESDYRQWMGNYGQDIASGVMRAEVF